MQKSRSTTARWAPPQVAAEAFASAAKAESTRRAYRAGVRAWFDWCDLHALPCLPARGADVAAFLADQRLRGRSLTTTIDLRRAAIRRKAAAQGETPGKKVAATAAILRQLLAPAPDDLRGLRDRALLLVGFAGALRRAELAAIKVRHLEPGERGIRLTLLVSKGKRGGRA